MPKRILIMGLPGSGKTTFSKKLLEHITNTGKTAVWFNADIVRKSYNDWDFSIEGRIRQSRRMRDLADSSTVDCVICDFVAPIHEMRTIFDANCTIWMDTISRGRFDDTNVIFEPPLKYDHRVLIFDDCNTIIDKFEV